MLRMFPTIFQPGKKEKTRHDYYEINNFKASHSLSSFLSKVYAIKSGITVAIIPKNNVQNLTFEGLANCATTKAAKSILAIS